MDRGIARLAARRAPALREALEMHDGRPAIEIRHDPITRSCHIPSPAVATGPWENRYALTADSVRRLEQPVGGAKDEPGQDVRMSGP